MRALAVLLLVANVLFFVWRFNAQLEDELAVRARTPPPPANAPPLQLLRELPELPPLREAMPVVALPTDHAPAAPAAEALSAASPPPQAAAAPDATVAGVAAAPDDTAPAAPTAEAAPASAPVAPAPPGTPGEEVAAEISPAPVAAAPAADSAPADAPIAAAPVVSPPPVAAAATVPSGVCVRVGPFAQDAAALRVSRWLRPRSSRVEIRHDGATGRPLFGIYLEPRSASEREQKLRELARQGVRDVQPVRREGMSHAISLGVFSSQENVNRRLAEIEKQGYRPIVVPRRDVGGSRYVEAELATGFDDPARLSAAELGGAAVTTVPCRP